MIPPRARTACILALLLASGAAGAACILVDPPAEIPSLAARRPIILRGSVVPPTTQILTNWPSEFVVPVEPLDVSRDLVWQAFVDDSFAGHGAVGGSSSLDGGIREILARLPVPAVASCHTIEIMVANSFQGPRTPDSLGGDSVVWFYSPTGDLTECPIYDAGPVINDGAFPDANGSGAPDAEE